MAFLGIFQPPQTATGKADAALPWLAAWQYLSEAIKDDEGTVLHRYSPP
jgi:hypothetical protein